MQDDINIKAKNLNPRDTDEIYFISHDPGDPQCKCSRCDRQMEEDGDWVRFFIDKGQRGEIILCHACLIE